MGREFCPHDIPLHALTRFKQLMQVRSDLMSHILLTSEAAWRKRAWLVRLGLLRNPSNRC